MYCFVLTSLHTSVLACMAFLQIPLQVKIRELSDAGQPLCVAEPGSAVAEAYSRIAVRLKEHLFGAEGEHQGGRLPEIVME